MTWGIGHVLTTDYGPPRAAAVAAESAPPTVPSGISRSSMRPLLEEEKTVNCLFRECVTLRRADGHRRFSGAFARPMTT